MLFGSKTPDVYFFLPMRLSDLYNRSKLIKNTLFCLRHSIRDAIPVLGNFLIHLHINDTRIGNCDFYSNIPFINKLLQPFPILYSNSADSGKIAAINHGLHNARIRNYDLFFCIDNDIIFDSLAIRQILETFKQYRKDAVTCMKMPLLHKNSTQFQILHAYFYQVLFELDIGPKRPTGSLYCIDPYKIISFLPNCNEADFLVSKNISQSDVVVRSELSRTIDEEIKRRVRLYFASQSINFLRFNDDTNFMNRLISRFEPNNSVLRSEIFQASKDIYFKILSEMKTAMSK